MKYAAIIWWSEAACPITEFAANEIHSYLEKMSGITLPIYEGKVASGYNVDHLSNAVFIITDDGSSEYMQLIKKEKLVIPNEWLVSADSKLANAIEDTFVIETFGNGLVLAGSNKRGTLYASYALLEQLGVRFFAPDFEYYQGHAEFIPSLSSSEIMDLYIKEEPDLKYRRKYIEEGWSHTPNNLKQLIDWMAKNRLNTLVYPMNYINQGMTKWDTWRDQLVPELQKRGIMLEVGGHGYDSFIPESRYKEDHPLWFADPQKPTVHEHERVEHRPANVFHITNDEALQTYIDNVILYLKEHPEITIFDAWPPDGAAWPKSDVDQFGGIPNAQAYVTNKLNEAVIKVLPGVRIETIAYVPATAQPNTRFMYDPSIIVDLAPYDRSYSELIYEPHYSMNVYYNNLLELWRDAGFEGDVCIYEYYTKYSWHSLPVILPALISKEIPHYAQTLKVKGLGIYSEPANWITYELTHYFVAALSWNTHIDASEFLDKYMQCRFANATNGMIDYYRLVEEAGRLLFDQANGNYGNLQIVTKVLDIYVEARRILASALTEAADQNTTVFLLQRLSWNIDFAIADTEINYYNLLGDAKEMKVAKERTQILVEAHALDGIILNSVWTMGRYLPDCTELIGRQKTVWIYDMYRNEW